MKNFTNHLPRIGFNFFGVVISIAILYLVDPGNVMNRKSEFIIFWLGLTAIVGLFLVRPKKPILQVTAGCLVSSFIFFLPLLVILASGFPSQD